MKTRITAFIIALVLSSIACDAVVPVVNLTSTPMPTAPMTATPLPTVTPKPVKPRILRVLYGLAYASTTDWKLIDPTDLYPHTLIPADINVVEVLFYLELPEGWPTQKVELVTHWYRDGMPIEGSDGSTVCSAGELCDIRTSKQFMSAGFGDGRIEIRLYIGDELLEGPQAEIWAIASQWVGNLRLMRCESGTADTCNNADGALTMFPEEFTVPAGSSEIYVGNAYANLPSGTRWQVELYRDAERIDSETKTITGSGTSSGWKLTQMSNLDGSPLEAGIYTVKLIWNGALQESITFEVQE